MKDSDSTARWRAPATTERSRKDAAKVRTRRLGRSPALAGVPTRFLFGPSFSFGVVAGVVILIMSVRLTYERQLIAWSNSHLKSTPPAEGAARLPVESLLEAAQQQNPGLQVTGITIGSASNDPRYRRWRAPRRLQRPCARRWCDGNAAVHERSPRVAPLSRCGR